MTSDESRLQEALSEERDRNHALMAEHAEVLSGHAALQSEVAALQDRVLCAQVEREHLEKRLLETEGALAPRLKSILTLAPLRFVLKEWRRIKSGGEPWRPIQLGDASRHGASDLWKKNNTTIGTRHGKTGLGNCQWWCLWS